jgi:hypothetical protein
VQIKDFRLFQTWSFVDFEEWQREKTFNFTPELNHDEENHHCELMCCEAPMKKVKKK